METPVGTPPAGGTYAAWLLRIWREGDGGAPVGFADLEHLFAYLSQLTDGGALIRSADPTDVT